MRGIGAMLNDLADNESSVAAFKAVVGAKIKEVTFSGGALHFVMDSGFKFRFEDQGQSCCEYRYMTCDDDLTKFSGANLTGAEVRDQPSGAQEYGEHEISFLVVDTSLGSFTCAAHNEHNGYYGGFSIRAVKES